MVDELTTGPAGEVGDRTLDDRYDAAGNKLQAGTRKGVTSTSSEFKYDVLGQVVEEKRPDESYTRTNFDASGNPTDRCFWKPQLDRTPCVKEAFGGSDTQPTQVTTTTYDARDQRITLENYSTDTVTTYDATANYQVQAVFQRVGANFEHQTLYEYDDERHRIELITSHVCQIEPDTHTCAGTTTPTGSSSYAYDSNDNRTRAAESNSAPAAPAVAHHYCYDSLNQLVYRNTGAACSTTAKDERTPTTTQATVCPQ